MQGYYHNSTIRIKEDAKQMKRGGLKRSSSLNHVPGTAARTTFKSKRESPNLIRFRREVRERDNHTCQFPGCGRSSRRIDVHHIAKRSQRPDLKFSVSNGICLCRTHHDWTDTHHDEAVRIGLLNTESYELAKKQERSFLNWYAKQREA